MAISRATTRAAAQAAALLLFWPVAVQAAGERVPLPVPRPDWLDASASGEADTTPTITPHVSVAALSASLPPRVPLPVPRPDFLDPLPTDDESGVTQVSRQEPAETETATSMQVSPLHSMIDLYARHHGVPERLAHYIVRQESRYNPKLAAKRHFGLMQVSLATAKSMGYGGDSNGLLDAKTNLTYSMPYLANAWIVSGGNEEKARRLYMSGYYPEAKRQGLLKTLRKADSPALTDESVADAR